MPTRRQEKVARVVKRAVSDAISQDLADPRVCGLVSVTRVEMAPDLRNAEVYLSIYAEKPAAEQRTFEAIESARRLIQARVADQVQSKFCPVLHFHRDEQFKKTLELMNLIDQAAGEYQHGDADEGGSPGADGVNGTPFVVQDRQREEQ
jgi:ribosome-binding factor A